jgi:hypothetical protein
VLAGSEQQQHQQQQGGNGPAAAGEGVEEEAGELLLLPVDAMEEAYEMGGSVLSVDLVRSLSTKVRGAACARHPSLSTQPRRASCRLACAVPLLSPGLPSQV